MPRFGRSEGAMNSWTSQKIVDLHDQALEREAEAARIAAGAAHATANDDDRGADRSGPVSLLRRLAHAILRSPQLRSNHH